jgi:thymidylate synthase (FAD)
LPINNNLKQVKLPMDLKFGQEPVTNYINNLESLNVEVIDSPTREQAQKIAWHMTKSTWADSPNETSFENASPEEASINLQDVLNFRALPTPMECLGFTFKISGIDVQTVTHLIRHRAGSFAAQCTGDRDLRNDNALVPESIENCRKDGDDFYFRYLEIIKQAKMLYSDMVDSKKVSMMDARVILPKCMETFYIARFNLKDLIGFIKQRQDVQIQPEVDNILATRIARAVCEAIPEVASCLDFNKPDMHYVRTFRVELPDGSFTSRGTNLYYPEPKNDLFEFNEKDSIYQCRREELNGNAVGEEKIFTRMWKDDVEAVSQIKQSLNSEF